MKCEKCEDANDPVKLRAEIEALRKQNAKNEDDAVRYRWLREWRSMEGLPYPTPPWVVRCELDPWPTTKTCHGTALDAAIDEAMLKTPNDQIEGLAVTRPGKGEEA